MGAKQSIVKAAGKGDMERVQHHLKKRGRAALFEKEPGGWTALHKAARKGRLEMVEYLIENMADIESIDAAMMTPCLLYTSPSPRDVEESRMPSSA